MLVHYPYTDPFSDSQDIDLSALSEAEKDLIDHCESTWGFAQVPVIKLSEKWNLQDEILLRKKCLKTFTVYNMPVGILYGFGV